ncbi:MAG: ferredoxin--NADP reductase [Promethearchaeota archaeon]
MEFETTVKDIILRTYNVKSFRFPRPRTLDYKPGQFMFVTIKRGQEEMRKHFSISSSPTESNFIEFTKKLTGSEFSNALDALEIGDWTKIDAPYGSFTFEGEFKKIAILSGGIGITPFISMCRYAADMQLNTEITILYGNVTERDIAFRKELIEMQKQNKNLKIVFVLSNPDKDWNGLTGFITSEIVKREIPDYLDRFFYTAGPPGMIKAMERLLEEIGLSKDQIRMEYFAGY